MLSPLFAAQYEACLKREICRTNDMKKKEAILIPDDMDYSRSDISLPIEARELLTLHRPSSVRTKLEFCKSNNYSFLFQLASAEKIPGIRAAALTSILYFLKKQECLKKS